MKIIKLLVVIILFSSCGDKHHDQIDAAIKSHEESIGHQVVSYEITSQKDSTVAGWYIVDYTAVVDGNKKTSGHLVFGKTKDDMLTQ